MLASSGEDALKILNDSTRFDLVITDMQMPDLDGLQLSQLIKAKYGVPIILLSSVGDESKRKHNEIFSAVLSKPAKQQQLFRVVHEGLAPKAAVKELMSRALKPES